MTEREKDQGHGCTLTSPGWVLRVPFLVPQTAVLGAGPAQGSILGHEATLTRDDPQMVLTLRGFRSEDDAGNFLPSARSLLSWATVSTGIGIKIEKEIGGRPTYSTDPLVARDNLNKNFGMALTDPVDGIVSGTLPTVFPADKHLRFERVSPVTSAQGYGAGQFLSALVAGAGHQSLATWHTDQRLQVALEAFSGSQFEMTPRVRFLLQITAVEALLEDEQQQQPILRLVDDLTARAQSHMRSLSTEHWGAVEALIQGVQRLKTRSISARFRSLVQWSLKVMNYPDETRLARRAKTLYGMRSKLVHTGEANVQHADCVDMKAIVKCVLEARMIHGSGGVERVMTQPTHEEIAARAYYRWLERQREGNAVADWLQAESDLWTERT